jgi:hypothetical protein
LPSLPLGKSSVKLIQENNKEGNGSVLEGLYHYMCFVMHRKVRCWAMVIWSVSVSENMPLIDIFMKKYTPEFALIDICSLYRAHSHTHTLAHSLKQQTLWFS